MPDAFLALSILAGWAYILRPRLTFRQMWYRWIYLRSRHWKALAKEKRASVGWKCEKCKERKPLDVHHKHYVTLGRERMKDLKALCRDCHIKEHKRTRKNVH